MRIRPSPSRASSTKISLPSEREKEEKGDEKAEVALAKARSYRLDALQEKRLQRQKEKEVELHRRKLEPKGKEKSEGKD